jgi:uncharacterized protein YqeY
MMTLLDTLKADALARRKARGPLGAFVNGVVAEAILVGKAKENREPTDLETLGVIKAYIKRAQQTIEMGEAGGRDMSASKVELALLQAYIPQQMDESALRAMIAEIAKEVGATTPKETGVVMKTLKLRHEGTFDPGLAIQVIKTVLTG